VWHSGLLSFWTLPVVRYAEEHYRTQRFGNWICFHPLVMVKREIIQSLHSKVSTVCQERQDLFNEVGSLKRDMQLSGSPQGFMDSVINSKGSSRPNKEKNLIRSVFIPYVKGVSEKFKRIRNRYDIRAIFKTSPTCLQRRLWGRVGS
jgi:hypothetical protein